MPNWTSSLLLRRPNANGWAWTLISLCLFSLLQLVSGQTSALAGEKPCTARDGDDFYDLTPLQNNHEDYHFTSSSGREFNINVCRNIVSETWGIDSDQVGASFRGERADVSIGSVNTALEIRHGDPLLTLTGGSPCPQSSSMLTSTAVRFICDTSVFGSGNPQLIAQLPPQDDETCAFFVEWRTHYACPTHEKTGAGGFIAVFAAVAIVAFVSYIVVGTIYRRYVLNLRGFDQLPRISIFSFSDSLSFCRGLGQRFKSRSAVPPTFGAWGRNRGGFQQLPTSYEEQESMLNGGRYSLDDDEEEVVAEENSANHPPDMDSQGVIRL